MVESIRTSESTAFCPGRCTSPSSGCVARGVPASNSRSEKRALHCGSDFSDSKTRPGEAQGQTLLQKEFSKTHSYISRKGEGGEGVCEYLKMGQPRGSGEVLKLQIELTISQTFWLYCLSAVPLDLQHFAGFMCRSNYVSSMATASSSTSPISSSTSPISRTVL